MTPLTLNALDALASIASVIGSTVCELEAQTSKSLGFEETTAHLSISSSNH
jgi:hypothetical protein